MSPFLLLLGAVTTGAGLALVTSGATGAFDAEIMTPGMIAAVGGLLLIGLGLTVRALQRIERALESRPMPHRVRPGEAPSVAMAERAEAGAQIPFPARPKPELGSRAAAASAALAPVEEAALERLREKFPTLVRLENAPALEEADVSLLPPAPAIAQGNGGAAINGGAVAHTNGPVAAPARMAPPANARASRPKGAMFDAFWPNGARPRKDAAETTMQASAPPAAEPLRANEAPVPEPRPVVEEKPAPSAEAPISVLKSGVVEGRAYTLYSDGSIEAQFPQGMMRFRSIGELRNHIESSS